MFTSPAIRLYPQTVSGVEHERLPEAYASLNSAASEIDKCVELGERPCVNAALPFAGPPRGSALIKRLPQLDFCAENGMKLSKVLQTGQSGQERSQSNLIPPANPRTHDRHWTCSLGIAAFKNGPVDDLPRR